MIMCEAEECVGAIWYHYECAGFPAGSEPVDDDKVRICFACTGMIYLRLSLISIHSLAMGIWFCRFIAYIQLFCYVFKLTCSLIIMYMHDMMIAVHGDSSLHG